MKFRKKPVIVEATQWFKNGDHPSVQPFNGYIENNKCVCGLLMSEHGRVQTLEGGHIVCYGDWIIRGVKDEFYPIKPDIFEQTYEKVEE